LDNLSALARLELAQEARDPSGRPPRKGGVASGDRIVDHLRQLLHAGVIGAASHVLDEPVAE
jgi:hypothetical protein